MEKLKLKDGAYAVYTTNSDWSDHTHQEVDRNGNETYYRDEGENHDWIHRQRDYIAKILQTLSFEELQIVEAFSNNEYLKKSAHILLTSNEEKINLTKKHF